MNASASASVLNSTIDVLKKSFYLFLELVGLRRRKLINQNFWKIRREVDILCDWNG
tara:strand:- start:840 stop:1007 length:168 start_codon:yes stop_codon:yes gene_type:complete